MNISGYRIEKQIGKGGMAMVYLAVQESLNRRVAIKIMNPLYSDSPEFSGRFLNEGRILAAIPHSNIITIYDIGISGPYHFISMEYVEGGDLAGRLKQGITPEEALDMVKTIASCLDAAHSVHIVHRDIKPANILFRKDGTLLLTDFGIAKQLGQNQNLTATGSMVGSPHYLSPEQAQGKAVDGRADIYSLGIIFYECLTGNRPFSGDSDVDIAIKHITEPLPLLPAQFSAYQPVIDAMTSKSPSERFPSCKSLIMALLELETSGQWSGKIADIPLPPPPAGNENTPSPDLPIVTTDHSIPDTGGDALVEQTVPDATIPDMVLTEQAPTLDSDTSADKTLPDSEAPTIDPAITKTPSHRGKTWYISVLIIISAIGLTVFVSLNLDPGKVLTAMKAPVESINSRLTDNSQARIQQLLQQAEEALQRRHLTTPEETSAYRYYQEILQIDPDNVEAEQGLDQIALNYHQLAKQAEDDWDYDLATYLVETGLSVRPDHKALLKLQKKLKEDKDSLGGKTKNVLKGVKGWFN